MRIKEVGVMKEMVYQRIKTYEMFRSIGKPDEVIMGVELNRRRGSNPSTPQVYDGASWPATASTSSVECNVDDDDAIEDILIIINVILR